MAQWMDERSENMDGWMDELMDEWVNGSMKEVRTWMDGWMDR